MKGPLVPPQAAEQSQAVTGAGRLTCCAESESFRGAGEGSRIPPFCNEPFHPHSPRTLHCTHSGGRQRKH